MLSAYLDGELAPEEKGLVEAHMKVCPRCAAEMAALERTVNEIRLFPFPALSPDFPSRVTARIKSKPAETPLLLACALAAAPFVAGFVLMAFALSSVGSALLTMFVSTVGVGLRVYSAAVGSLNWGLQVEAIAVLTVVLAALVWAFRRIAVES